MGCISCGIQLQLCGFVEVIHLRQEERELIFDVRRHAQLDGIFPCGDCKCGGEGVVRGVLALSEPCEVMVRQQLCAQVVLRSWEMRSPFYMRRTLIVRHANHRFLVPDESMEFIPCGNDLRSPVKFAELFCGGFSGWTRASIFMASRAFPGRVTFSLDRDREVFEVHKRNFACREIQETGFAMNDLKDKAGCCACISRFEPLCAIGLQGATGWLCSPPCPAFSSGGARGGLGLWLLRMYHRSRRTQPFIVNSRLGAAGRVTRYIGRR